MKKILLVNLPGKYKYLREYFCSKISKAKYYYPALNLVYISGYFDKNKYETFVFDAIAESKDPIQSLNNIKNINPDYIYFLGSAPSFREDKQFIKDLKSILPSCIIIGDGDLFRELKSDCFNIFPELDAVCLNFGSNKILEFIENPGGQVIENIIYKYNGNIIQGKENFKVKSWEVPIPKWDLFKHELYNHPFAISEKSTVMLTDFGCAFNCSFCPMSNIDWSMRDLDLVKQEIQILKGFGINDIFFVDQTFGVNKKRSYDLCEILKELNIQWCCFSRVDIVNEDLIKVMSNSGCHTIIFGIESSNEELLKLYKKNTKTNSMINAVNLCKKYKLRTCGTFIIGLPGDNTESIKNSIKFSRTLGLDFASFNIATPRIGTNFRDDMINQGWANKEDLDNLESAKQKESSWKHHDIEHNSIINLQSYAIKSFYLRPSYLFKRIINVRSFIELKNLVFEGFYLIFKR